MYLSLSFTWKYFSNVWWPSTVGIEHQDTYKPFGHPVSLAGALVRGDGAVCQLRPGRKQMLHLNWATEKGLIRDHLWRCGQGSGERAKIRSVCCGPKGRRRESCLELPEGLHTGGQGAGAVVFSTRTQPIGDTEGMAWRDYMPWLLSPPAVHPCQCRPVDELDTKPSILPVPRVGWRRTKDGRGRPPAQPVSVWVCQENRSHSACFRYKKSNVELGACLGVGRAGVGGEDRGQSCCPKGQKSWHLNALAQSSRIGCCGNSQESLRRFSHQSPQFTVAKCSQKLNGKPLWIPTAHVSGFHNLQGTSVWFHFLARLHPGIFPLGPFGFLEKEPPIPHPWQGGAPGLVTRVPGTGSCRGYCLAGQGQERTEGPATQCADGDTFAWILLIQGACFLGSAEDLYLAASC